MKRRTIITSFLGVLLTGGGLLMGGSSVGALTWQESVPVEFTFNPSLTVSLSSADLAINNLMPGNVSDSNAITVNVKSNWGGGYTLSSTVGSATLANDGGAIYDTNALIHSSYTSADNADIAGGTYTKPIFSSISGNVTAITADDTWGYSYSTDGGASWINAAGTAGYSELPKYSDETGGATLKETKTTTAEAGDNVGFKIAAKAGTEQDGGEYRNVINFTVVGKATPTTSELYSTIADMSKGKQTAADLQAAITVPTSDNPKEDTSNSGVYEYDASVFGAASDASNENPIYYYRGVLEKTVGSYGSDGSATTYPNYVVLSSAKNKSELKNTDTCWRIVRTTGSGGIKMIYNGLWTGSTCANSQGNAQVTTKAFNSSYNSIVYVGYTYNSSFTANSTTNGKSPNEVFGGGTYDASVNNTRSTIKTYIEDEWYDTKLSAYTSILEPNAGYCNDRSYYGTTTGTTAEEIQSSISTSGTVYFGARNRNFVNDSVGPTLGCTRGDVDIYRYVEGSEGKGNELKRPVALLTGDESALAGSGRSSGNPTTYSANSFLRSGSNFWLLSPVYRSSVGAAFGFYLYSNGTLDGYSVNVTIGVRPAISLSSEAELKSGTGVATEPWIVNPPSS